MFRCHFRLQKFESSAHQKELNLLHVTSLGHHCLLKLLDHTLKPAWLQAQARWNLAVCF